MVQAILSTNTLLHPWHKLHACMSLKEHYTSKATQCDLHQVLNRQIENVFTSVYKYKTNHMAMAANK